METKTKTPRTRNTATAGITPQAQALANLQSIAASGQFIQSGTGTKFWIPNMDKPMVLPVVVGMSANNNIWLQTPKTEGIDAVFYVQLGDFYAEVQDLPDEVINTEILVKVYERTLNPALTLDMINATADRFKKAAEAAGEVYADNFASVRTALVNRDSGKACKSLLLADLLD
tara:strand:+ start:3187 stop:3705 length:519 start_codon:yes stop_codon:yes gene_type:complete